MSPLKSSFHLLCEYFWQLWSFALKLKNLIFNNSMSEKTECVGSISVFETRESWTFSFRYGTEASQVSLLSLDVQYCGSGPLWPFWLSVTSQFQSFGHVRVIFRNCNRHRSGEVWNVTFTAEKNVSSWKCSLQTLNTTKLFRVWIFRTVREGTTSADLCGLPADAPRSSSGCSTAGGTSPDPLVGPPTSWRDPRTWTEPNHTLETAAAGAHRFFWVVILLMQRVQKLQRPLATACGTTRVRMQFNSELMKTHPGLYFILFKTFLMNFWQKRDIFDKIFSFQESKICFFFERITWV